MFLGGVVSRDVVPLNPKWTLIRSGVTLAVICLVAGFTNYFLPAKRWPWRWMTPGSLLTAFCFVIASALFSF